MSQPDGYSTATIAGTTIQIEALILGSFVTLIVIFICTSCPVNICLVRCWLLRNGYGFCPCQHHRYIESHPAQDDEESDRDRRDLSQAPPPAYKNINQYQNVDLEQAEVVRIKEACYRLSVHCKSTESTSLPPDYTSHRLSVSVAPQEIQAGESQLPPLPYYDTTQLELMARRSATEEGTLREYRTSLLDVNTEKL